MSHSVYFSFFTFFTVSRHITSPTLCVSHFPWIDSFLAIIQALQCSFLIVHVFKCFSPYSSSNGFCVSFSTFFQFSRHIPGETVFVSHFPRFSVFWPYCRSYNVLVYFSTFFSFFAIIQVLWCTFLIFHVFHCFLPFSRSYSVHFSFSTFLSVFLHIPG